MSPDAWKLPPVAKAFGAVADGRVRPTGPGRPEVDSSGRDRTYPVEWSADRAGIVAEADGVLSRLAALELERPARRRRPPP